MPIIYLLGGEGAGRLLPFKKPCKRLSRRSLCGTLLTPCERSFQQRKPCHNNTPMQTLVGCFGNVLISPKREKGAHPGFTRLRADLNCMEDLVRSRFQRNYVINLCGQDFPIKTNKEIVRYIRSKWDGKHITPGVSQPANTKPTKSQSQPEPTPKVSPSKGFKEEPPHNLTVYFGSAHYVLTRAFVQFVLTDARAKDMPRRSAAPQSPERPLPGDSEPPGR